MNARPLFRTPFGFKFVRPVFQQPTGSQEQFRRAANSTIRLNGAARSSLFLSEGLLHVQNPSLASNLNRILGPAHFRNFEGLLATFRDKALVYTGTDLPTFSEGIVIGGQTHNWWHWLIEVLPKAFIAARSEEEWAGWPIFLLLAEDRNSNWKQTIDIVLKGNAVKWAPQGQFFRVEGAVFWNGGVVLSTKELEPYRALLRQQALSASPIPSIAGKRIFLKRAEGRGRKFNQKELAAVSEDFGFQIIDPEDISLAELWGILSRATIVAGAQGAGWANTIVCPEGTIGLQWAAGALRGPRFQDLADLCKMDLRTMLIDGDPNGAYRVDVGDFTKQLEMLVLEAD